MRDLGIRDLYGEQVAEAVEWVAHLVNDARDRPSAQDIKHTLRRIVEKPGAVDLRLLDGYSKAELVTVALQQHRTWRLHDLSPQQLAECARLALQRPRRGSGPNSTDGYALMLVTKLLSLTPTSTPAERDEMLSNALLACGLGAGKKTVERLLTKAGQVL